MRNTHAVARLLLCAVGIASHALAEGAPAGANVSKVTVLYSFCAKANCADGAAPGAGLIADAQGNLYGTTTEGGIDRHNGVVFEITRAGKEAVLHHFCSQVGCADGSHPDASLIADAQGNLYGTTVEGGANDGNGTVFELTPEGKGRYKETVLYSFCAAANCADGATPLAGLLADAQGNLYGTTVRSVANYVGVVFELTPNRNGHYKERVLYTFCSKANCADGAAPYAGLIADAQGNLYGTTANGGATGNGTVFELTPKGNGHYKETVLHNFCTQTGCTEGKAPYAGVIADAQGNLYGTTSQGGIDNGGAVFELKPQSNGHYEETVLYSFCMAANCADGQSPQAGLIADAQGNLYGTTGSGGANDEGTVFELKPNRYGPYRETVLHSFCALPHCGEGGLLPAGLIADAQDSLYGVTVGGGANDAGTVFKLRKK